MALRLGNAARFSSHALLRRSRLSAATAAASRRALAVQSTPDSEAGAGDAKTKIHSAWNSSAEAYVGNIQDGGGPGECSSSPPKVSVGLSVGYKLAARTVASLSNNVHLKDTGAPVVLDVASAGGEPAITIAKSIPDSTVHATDFAPAMMDLIRRRATDAGVSNVSAGVADGEALTGFGDESVDAVTCTWGLMFMPNWQQAIQEFSRVVRSDGIVALTLWEKHDNSIFERVHRVLDTLVPGYEAAIDPIALGEDEGSAVAEEMKAAGLRDVSVSQFAVPVVLSPEGRPGDIFEFYTLSSPLGQTMSTLEAKGRTNVRQEAQDIFESHMETDWAEGRSPLGLVKKPGDSSGGGGTIGSSGDPAGSQEPQVFYKRALLVLGRK